VTALRPLLILLGFAALTLPLMPLQFAFTRLWPAMARRFPMHFHRLLARLIGLRITVKGVPHVDGPTLIVSNHLGWIDIVALSAVTPLSFVAKREVAGWPFFGSLARLQRTVFVDRQRRHATGTGRDQDRLKAGDTLVLFPEGTSSDGFRVQPFKSSFFAAAAQPGVVVQPVTLAFHGHRGNRMNRRLMPFYAWYGDMVLAPHLWQSLKAGPFEATVVFHPPLSLSGETNRKALAAHAERLVREGLVATMRGR
jgi:1-acyl-sn-glycerol-3-phosphate acyltransferase